MQLLPLFSSPTATCMLLFAGFHWARFVYVVLTVHSFSVSTPSWSHIKDIMSLLVILCILLRHSRISSLGRSGIEITTWSWKYVKLWNSLLESVLMVYQNSSIFLFNWDSLHTRLNSHWEARIIRERLKAYEKTV